VGRAGAKASINVRSTSILKSINLLGIESGSGVGLRARVGLGVGETVILASSVGISSSELKSSEFRSLPDLFFKGVIFSHRLSIC